MSDYIIDDMSTGSCLEKGLSLIIVDVFCEARNYFSQQETEDILNAGANMRLIPKVRANQH